MDVANSTAALYRSIFDLGWEAEPVKPKRVDGNLLYVAKLRGPAGQVIERTGISEQWALVNALHFAQRQNFLRGAALENTMPTHQQLPGVRYNKAVTATERDVNHGYTTPYASEFNDEMRSKSPDDQRIPEVIVNHVKDTVNAIDTGWYLSQDPNVWKSAVMNAFRAALLSPRKDFKWNVVHYQDIMDMPHDSNSGDMLRRLESRRQAWNAVFRGDPLVHVRYKKQLKRLENMIAERDPSLSKDDVRGIALGLIGKLMAHAEKAHVSYVMKDPKRFRDGEWVDSPTGTETGSAAQDYVMGQLDMSMGLGGDITPPEPYVDEKGKLKRPPLTPVQKAYRAGLKPLNLEDYIQEARGEYELGSFKGPQEEDLERARQGQKTIKENYGAFIYTHLDAIEAVGKHINELAQFAHDDITKHGGTGHYFRNQTLNLGILGTNPKVTSLAWLLLSPKTSQLGTMDTHMARLLTGSPETGTYMPGNDETSAGSPHHYYNMERQLQALRDRSGYSHIPLGQYQWITWDWVRQGGGDVGPGSDHRGMRVQDPTFYGDIEWPRTQRKQFGSGQVNYFHPPEWMHDAYEGRREVAKEYVDTYGGYSVKNRPDPSKPKPPKDEQRAKHYQLWGIQQPVEEEQLLQPMMAAYYVGDLDDVMLPLFHGHAYDYEPGYDEYLPYEAEDDAIHHSKAYEYGQSLKDLPRLAAKKKIEELADTPSFFTEAMRGYTDAVREVEDRNSERTASSRTQEAQVLIYPTSYDLERIARSFEVAVDFDALDMGLEDEVTWQRQSNRLDAFDCAAKLTRTVQKVTGHDGTAMVAGILFLTENGYPHAAEAVDDVELAEVIAGMRVGTHRAADAANLYERDISDSAERKPDFRFVFYKGVLDIRDWDHNLRFRNMIRQLIQSYGKDVTDKYVEDDEIASGDVYKNEDGTLDIELESLADNDVQNQAVNAVHKWAEGINLIGPVKVY